MLTISPFKRVRVAPAKREKNACEEVTIITSHWLKLKRSNAKLKQS